MIQHKKRRRSKNPPAPLVIALGRGEYAVRSRRSDRLYRATANPDGTIVCRCPAQKDCYHRPHVERAHELANLRPGDSVLVSEAGGQVWHGVFHVDESRVYTFEEPSGFRHVFVVACERRERQAA